MRAAKERKRLARSHEEEPRFVRWHPLEFGVRDRVTGETVWMELRSGRDVAKRLAVLLRYYEPGLAGGRVVTRPVDGGGQTRDTVGA